MIIELYGLPGSGKTSLAKKIVGETDFEIIKIKSKKELLYFNFLFLVKHPIKFFKLLFFVISNSLSSSKLFYYKLMNCFFDYNAKYQKALRCKFSIIDQGYFQNIISVFNKEISPKFLKKYIKFFILPDKLIILDINKKKRLAMMKKRGYFARDKFGRIYRKKWEKIIEYNDKILKKSLANKNVPVDYLIVKDKDISNYFKEIIKKVKKRSGSQKNGSKKH